MRYFLTFVFALLALSASAKSHNSPVLNVVMDKIKFEQWENAQAFTKYADDPIVNDIYEWHALRAHIGTLSDYLRFLETKNDWPGLPLLQKRGEQKINAETTSQDIIRLIEFHGPQSAKGLKEYIKALSALGHTDKAEKALQEGLTDLSIPYEDMQSMRKYVTELSAESLENYVHELLDRRQSSIAASYVEAFELEKRRMIEARIALLENSAQVKTYLEWTNGLTDIDPRLNFELARYAFNNRNREVASKIMEDASISAEALARPELWMQDEMRTRLAGDALWIGEAERGYQLVANHYIKPEDDGYALAEWNAGWIALDFLNDSQTALKHFKNYKSVVNTPISSGRAGYWLGRAGDPEGYKFGAQFQTSFYGQLAAEAAGIAPDQSLIAEPTATFDSELLKKDSVRAGMYFASIGEALLAHRFFAHEAETLPPEQAESLGIFASQIGLTHATIGIGKNLAKRNEILPFSYYPIPDLFSNNLPVPRAISLAITRRESEFYQFARSPVGALGFMQLMPATGALMAEREGLAFTESKLTQDGAYNIQLGASYLDFVGNDYNDILPLMAVSYNAGPSRAQEWLDYVGPLGPRVEDAVYWLEMIRFEETRNYVQRVIEAAYIYDAKLHGEFRLKPSDLLLKPYR